ncbi:uncharacterized protein LOC121180026 [Toxotes jaculatrix]|uniref:uncharacterized protein LOC121180026 n=1 Tax=Toxotes jaculatrix TaxID=941984 RepID=UPI001B3AE04C|nr:uncharacterized protein LOC121180026 [Toxotes jaculatrix]
MEFTALHILWLVSAFSLTTQELKLIVIPKITAECDKQVTLQCSVPSSVNGLSIKLMEWSHSRTSWCSVNGERNITYKRNTLNDFHCEYKEGQLSVIFQKVQPLQSGLHMCKLQSNKGPSHEYTTVELEECCGTVTGVLTSRGPSCTFKNVYPDSDVHWFSGSHNLSDGSLKHNTTKRVEEGGWLTIHSDLEHRSSDVPFNCSLKSSTSGRYIASALVQKGRALYKYSQSNGVRSAGPLGTFCLCISILLAVTLK